MLLSLVLAVVFSVLAVYFASYNPQVIVVNVFGHPEKGGLGVIIVVAVGLGVLLGILVMLPSLLGKSWALIRHRRKIEDLQNAVQQTQRKDIPPE
jgi:hypothetical protein